MPTIFFPRADANGTELWSSNGTVGGNALVKDINPGSASSNPSDFLVAGDTVFFVADDGVHGREPWRSDGTAAGTTLVADINPGAGTSTPSLPFAVGDSFYFAADDAVHGTELWRTDGTPAGTSLVSDIYPGLIPLFNDPYSSFPEGFAFLGNVLYFAADDGVHGRELWRSDDTATGTFLVKDIQLGAFGSAIQDLTAYNSRLYFGAYDGIDPYEFWTSDGTAAGTSVIANVSVDNLTNVGGLLYFGGFQPGVGFELWRSDGTASGTFMVKELVPGVAGGSPSDFVSYGGRIYFLADTGAGDRSLWVTDGTDAGTALVKTGSFESLTPADGLLFAAGYDSTNGTELWKSDGTTAGTALVKDLFPGTHTEWFPDPRGPSFPPIPVVRPNSSSPNDLTGDTKLFFAATDADGTGLWRSDGTADGTLKLSPLSPLASSNSTFHPVLGYMASGISGPVQFQAPALGLTGVFAGGPSGGRWDSQSVYPRQLADINGDGRADIVGFGAAGVYVSLADQAGVGDFALPGLALAIFGSDPSAGSWSSQDSCPRLLGDVNGDGRADIVGFGAAGVYVALANPSGGFWGSSLALAIFGSDPSAGGWTSQDTYPRLLGDVNGDGRADIVGFGSDRVWVAFATGDGQFASPTPSIQTYASDPAAGGWTSNDLYRRELADVNGDGRADIVGFASDGVYVSLAEAGDGFASPIQALAGTFGADPAAGGWTSNDLYPRELADVNGDGRADIVGFGAAGMFVALGQGDGTFAAPQFELSSYGSDPAAGGWTGQDMYPRLLGDITGDHWADVVGFGGGGVYVSQAG